MVALPAALWPGLSNSMRSWKAPTLCSRGRRPGRAHSSRHDIAQDRNFTFRSAFDVAAKKYITLADEIIKGLDVCA
jgi:hypothetical protein